MTHPTALEVARAVRDLMAKGGLTRPVAARVSGLSERQLRRRLDGETAFAAHELIAIINAVKDAELLKDSDLLESLDQMARGEEGRRLA